jgi:hypothetical protein
MEYMVVESNEAALFESQIDEAFRQGWELYGNMCVGERQAETWYYQAMIRKVEAAGDDTKD